MSKIVMIVEDDTDIRESLKTFLEYDGFDVIVANHGKEALDLLDSKIPDVILLDMMMPVMNGAAFLEKFKQGKFPKIPVIVLSASHRPDLPPDCLFVQKPIDLDVLINQINDLPSAR